MAATFAWCEDNGAASGIPAHGTPTVGVSDANWKNADDTTTPYSTAVIPNNTNSYEKFLYGKFTGSFSLVSSGLFAHTAGASTTGVTLKGVVTSTYTTPGTAANAALTTDMSAVLAIGSGAAVLFSTTGPQDVSPTATLAAAGYSQYMVTQQQHGTVAAGDTATLTLTFQYSES